MLRNKNIWLCVMLISALAGVCFYFPTQNWLQIGETAMLQKKSFWSCILLFIALAGLCFLPTASWWAMVGVAMMISSYVANIVFGKSMSKNKTSHESGYSELRILFYALLAAIIFGLIVGSFYYQKSPNIWRALLVSFLSAIVWFISLFFTNSLIPKPAYEWQ